LTKNTFPGIMFHSVQSGNLRTLKRALWVGYENVRSVSLTCLEREKTGKKLGARNKRDGPMVLNRRAKRLKRKTTVECSILGSREKGAGEAAKGAKLMDFASG